jgi:hypothetical protein
LAVGSATDGVGDGADLDAEQPIEKATQTNDTKIARDNANRDFMVRMMPQSKQPSHGEENRRRDQSRRRLLTFAL